MTTQTASSGLSGITARQWLILLTVQLCTLLFGMTITLANVVLPQIKGSMSATQDQIAWVVTFNLVATAVGTPLTGWLAQPARLAHGDVRVGARLYGLLVPVRRSRTSLETLILFRIGQGLFGAPIMPMGQAILLATFPRHLHPMVMMIWGIGGVIGPVRGRCSAASSARLYDWRGVVPDDRAARPASRPPAPGSRSPGNTSQRRPPFRLDGLHRAEPSPSHRRSSCSIAAPARLVPVAGDRGSRLLVAVGRALGLPGRTA